jgi:hypothetical protein
VVRIDDDSFDRLLNGNWKENPDLEVLLKRLRVIADWNIPSLDQIKGKGIDKEEFEAVKLEIDKKMTGKDRPDEKVFGKCVVGMVRGIIAGYPNAPRRLNQVFARARRGEENLLSDWELETALFLRGVEMGDVLSAVVVGKMLHTVNSTQNTDKNDQRVKAFLNRCRRNWETFTEAKDFKELVMMYNSFPPSTGTSQSSKD